MKPARAAAACALFACCALGAQAQTVAKPDPFGDAMEYALPAGAAILALVHDDTEGLKGLGYTLVLSQGTTAILKPVIDAKRPDGTGEGFPSGHTSAVFASAGFVRQRYGWQESVPFYVLATATAWSRVNTHHHFAKDVVGGALIGEGSAMLVGHWMGPRTTASVGYGGGGAWVRVARVW
ncbi:phosphatase PAP2 family protein [Ramlibacter sp. G-1-2-2]|uniref:Phosphatase PAP2 family protein n=1 Tax=Ramlibacter agri TaxID=2728837 RepID=A0A848H2L0_9BURK|nr:phosphatase PAP2 family protein [Ramlibacter agri]NML42943.1 phosphatase PAP2 family protein [Ramlibacter agri]